MCTLQLWSLRLEITKISNRKNNKKKPGEIDVKMFFKKILFVKDNVADSGGKKKIKIKGRTFQASRLKDKNPKFTTPWHKEVKSNLRGMKRYFRSMGKALFTIVKFQWSFFHIPFTRFKSYFHPRKKKNNQSSKHVIYLLSLLFILAYAGTGEKKKFPFWFFQ